MSLGINAAFFFEELIFALCMYMCITGPLNTQYRCIIVGTHMTTFGNVIY